MGSGDRGSWVWMVAPPWPWVSYLTFLIFGSLICKMQTQTVRIQWERACAGWHKGSSVQLPGIMATVLTALTLTGAWNTLFSPCIMNPLLCLMPEMQFCYIVTLHTVKMCKPQTPSSDLLWGTETCHLVALVSLWIFIISRLSFHKALVQAKKYTPFKSPYQKSLIIVKGRQRSRMTY